jgi:hypothetical protein
MHLTNIEQYLLASSELVAASNTHKHGEYHSIMEFVYKNGQNFKRIGKRPKSLRKGRNHYCFANATRLALNCPSLIYCEGYALGIIPVHHAWVVTRRGTVIDPTWNDANQHEYYGVPINHSYLRKSILEYGVYGLIDLWEHGWPILKAKPKQFLEPL